HVELKSADGTQSIESCATSHSLGPDRRYVRPVSYDQHCKTCHPIALPGTEGLPTEIGPALAHDRLEIVRAQLADLPGQYLHYLTAARSPKEIAGELSPAEWSKQQAAKLTTALASKATSLDNAYHDRIEKLVASLKAANQAEAADELDKHGDDLVDAAKKDARVLAEFAVVYFNDKTSCVKCH